MAIKTSGLFDVFDPIKDAFEDAADEVVGGLEDLAREAEDVANAAKDLGLLVGDGLGDAVLATGGAIADFGKGAARFSIAAGGAVVDWATTSADEIKDWAENAGDAIVDFGEDAFDELKDAAVAAYEALRDALADTLPRLGPFDDTVGALAKSLLPGIAHGFEAWANSNRVTIALSLKFQAGAGVQVGARFGMYVGRRGGGAARWGLFAADLDNAIVSSLQPDAGAKFTVDITVVFDGVDGFSGTKYYDIGADVNIKLAVVGASVLVRAKDLKFLGFEARGGIGVDLPKKPANAAAKPKLDYAGAALHLDQFVQDGQREGARVTAATEVARAPSLEARVRATVLATQMKPFRPIFYGTIKASWGDPKSPDILYHDANGKIGYGTPPPGSRTVFRLVAGLKDPTLVSLESLDADGNAPRYLHLDQKAVEKGHPAKFAAFANTDAFKRATSFSLVRALNGGDAVSLPVEKPPGARFPLYLALAGGELIAVDDDPSDSPESIARTRNNVSLRLISATPPARELAVLPAPGPQDIGAYRRSPDGRYFAQKTTATKYVMGTGSGPKDVRTPPAAGLPGGWAGDLPAALGHPVDPGPYFRIVSETGHIVAIRGEPERPAEVVHSTQGGHVFWSTARRPLLIRGPNGKYLGLPTGKTYGTCTATALGPGEVFELHTLCNGKVALRSRNGCYASTSRNTGTVDQRSMKFDRPMVTEPCLFTLEVIAARDGIREHVRLKDRWGTYVQLEASGRLVPGGKAGEEATMFTALWLADDPFLLSGETVKLVGNHNGQVMTILDGRSSRGAVVQQAPDSGGLHQRFTLVHVGDGDFAFRALHSGQVFDIRGASRKVHEHLLLHPWHGGDNQRFRLSLNDDGSYTIRAKHSGLILGPTSGKKDTGIPIAQDEPGNVIKSIDGAPGGVPHQRWRIVPAPVRVPANPSSGWTALGGTALQDVRGLALRDGCFLVYVIAKDGSLRLRRQATAGGVFAPWQNLGGKLKKIAAAQNLDGRVFLFGVAASNNRLLLRAEKEPGGDWLDWLDLGGALADIEAGHYYTGKLAVFARGADNALWELTQKTPAGAWGSWVSHGGGMTDRPAIARADADHLHVFVRGTGGDLWARRQDNRDAPVNQWTGFGGGTLGSPTVVQNRTGALEVFAGGPDKALYCRWQTAPNAGWAAYANLGGAALDPVAVTRADGDIAVYARDADGQIRVRRQLESGWKVWEQLGGQLVGAPAPMVGPRGVGVAARFADGAAWYWWGEPDKPRTVADLMAAPHKIRRGDLEFSFTNRYQMTWEDKKSGGTLDGAYFRPVPPAGFFALGHHGQRGYTAPKHYVLVVKDVSSDPDRPALRPPVALDPVWNDKGSGATLDGSFWRPRPPPGYVALGLVSARGHGKPRVDEIRCVRADLAVAALPGDLIWDDRKTGSNKDFGSWKIVPPASPPPNEAWINPGTFFGVASHTRPKKDSLLWALRVPLK